MIEIHKTMSNVFTYHRNIIQITECLIFFYKEFHFFIDTFVFNRKFTY